MKTDQIKLEFQNEYKGKVIAPNGEIKIGRGENEYAPYHLLYGALGSCYYLTFLALCRKQKLEFDRVKITIDGEKHETSVALLKEVIVDVEIWSKDDKERITRAAGQGAKYCSIYNTIQSIPAEVILKVKVYDEY